MEKEKGALMELNEKDPFFSISSLGRGD